ncbi:MAG: zinc-ribbon domain-containing protein [Anaerohalosphaeraceae bacterium]
MTTQCPVCKTIFKADEKYKGKTVKCPKCQEIFRVIFLNEHHNTSITEDSQTSNTVKSDYSDESLRCPSMADKILQFAFSVAYVVSAIIVVICVIVILICLFVTITLHSQSENYVTFNAPTFAEYIKATESSQESFSAVSRQSSERLDEEKYMKEFNSLISTFGLPRNILMNWLTSYEDDYKEHFLKGLEQFLREAEKYNSSQGKKRETLNFLSLSNYYNKMFNAAIMQNKKENENILKKKLVKQSCCCNC